MTYNLDIENRFTYHPVKDGQAEKYERLRARGREFAELLAELCPPSPELSRAVAHVDEAVMNGNAAIARHS